MKTLDQTNLLDAPPPYVTSLGHSTGAGLGRLMFMHFLQWADALAVGPLAQRQGRVQLSLWLLIIYSIFRVGGYVLCVWCY